jgi:large subunit ribosomal protein L2
MPLIKLKPTTASRRGTKLIKFSLKEHIGEYTTAGDIALAKKLSGRRIKGIVTKKNYKAGKNFRGVITTRHKGGQVKRLYRVIDTTRSKRDMSAKVVNVEYDPNRSANIALLKYADGEFSYIISPEGLKIGDVIMASANLTEVKVGNAHPLSAIPAATFVHNVELVPGKGGVLARGAGTSVQIQGLAGKGYVQLKLPSGEIRLVNEECYATIGIVGNIDHGNQNFGKAGRMRKKGIRPTVRGVAQSYKHPHAGGQGKSGRHGTGGPSKDPWGNKRGKITRKNKQTNKFIIARKTSNLRPKNKPYKTIV